MEDKSNEREEELLKELKDKKEAEKCMSDLLKLVGEQSYNRYKKKLIKKQQ